MRASRPLLSLAKVTCDIIHPNRVFDAAFSPSFFAATNSNLSGFTQAVFTPRLHRELHLDLLAGNVEFPLHHLDDIFKGRLDRYDEM
jgi:hypothetical protein